MYKLHVINMSHGARVAHIISDLETLMGMS